MDVRRLCVGWGNLSRRFLPILALGVIAVFPAADARGHAHHASKVRFAEHSPATFDAARREGKPVFLLVSAVWCYWCKYFEQQVLADVEVSKYLNQHYLSVFVDYDRRPDLVRKYVRGLPMIVLFGPDGRVRQSFAGVLKKEDFLAVVRRVITSPPLAADARPVAPPDPAPVTLETYQRLREGMVRFIAEHLDPVHGGFGTGDKHPQPRLLAYLLELHETTGDHRYLVAVEKSLAGILGALYDRVDGGFFRYAEGREWRQPHYEKLLHLNAALAAVLGEAHRVTRNPRYREAADATIAYLLRNLHDATGGGFYSSQSADPVYYRLSLQERRAARRPPVNRDKVAAWNAEAAIALLELGQSSGRKDLRDVALGTLEFIRGHLVGERGSSTSTSTGQGGDTVRASSTPMRGPRSHSWRAIASREWKPTVRPPSECSASPWPSSSILGAAPSARTKLRHRRSTRTESWPTLCSAPAGSEAGSTIWTAPDASSPPFTERPTRSCSRTRTRRFG